jgi:hypothetical protein
MNAFFSKSNIQRKLTYLAAYLLMAGFAILGIVITESLRSNVLPICHWLHVDPDITYILYSWGGFVLYLPYVVGIVLMESYLNNGVKKGQVWARLARVAAIEGGVWLVSVLINWIYTLTG